MGVIRRLPVGMIQCRNGELTCREVGHPRYVTPLIMIVMVEVKKV